MRGRVLLVTCLVGAIIVAHVFLWMSEMDSAYKLTFTLINAVAWTIVLAPILLVDRWLEAVQRRNRGESDAEDSDR